MLLPFDIILNYNMDHKQTDKDSLPSNEELLPKPTDFRFFQNTVP